MHQHQETQYFDSINNNPLYNPIEKMNDSINLDPIPLHEIGHFGEPQQHQPLYMEFDHQVNNNHYANNTNTSDLHILENISHATDVTRLDHIPTTLRNLPSKGMSVFDLAAVHHNMAAHRKRQSLPPEYKPGDFDVCCGRGKRHWNHIGNVRFRRKIQNAVERYMAAPSKTDKTAVVVSIVADIRQLGGLFLKEDLRGNWYDIGDQQAREKVGHSLRDQVSTVHRQVSKHQALEKYKAQQQKTQGASTASQAAVATPAPMITPATSPVPSRQLQSLHGPRTIISGTAHDTKNLVGTSMGETPLDNYQLYGQQEQQEYERDTDPSRQGQAGDDGVNDDDTSINSDGHNERHSRRSILRSSLILDKFARRPSFVSMGASAANAAAAAVSSVDLTKSSLSSSKSSKRSSGWSFLNDLDFNTDMLEADFQDGLEPIALTKSVAAIPKAAM